LQAADPGGISALSPPRRFKTSNLSFDAVGFTGASLNRL